MAYSLLTMFLPYVCLVITSFMITLNTLHGLISNYNSDAIKGFVTEHMTISANKQFTSITSQPDIVSVTQGYVHQASVCAPSDAAHETCCTLARGIMCVTSTFKKKKVYINLFFLCMFSLP